MLKHTKREGLLQINDFLEEKEKIDVNNKTFSKAMFVYSVAMKELVTKLEIIKEEFRVLYDYELIDHINTRIKTPESILKKMENKTCEYTYAEMINNINDIAGVRVICPLKKDIFAIRNLILNLPQIRVLKEKDYVTRPKKSGYSSYHLILEIPVTLSQKTIYVKVEVQIRTIAMDFWASIEHRAKYKPECELTKKASKEFISYAKLINKIDNNLVLLNSKLSN